MHLDYSDELAAFRVEMRDYFKQLLAGLPTGSYDELRAGRGREITRQIGKDGWLGIGWPREFGGLGRTAAEQYVFFDEAKRAGVPMPMLAMNTVGPTLMHHGTAEQKARFLPRILSGEIDFAIGYTEPGAGTDLAAIKTRAVRRGDTYIINGQKIFTSGADESDYIWLAARTDPDAPKHKGLSIFIVPTNSPGFSWAPLRTIPEGSARTNSVRGTTTTFYDEIILPAENLVGPENAGWQLITQQLNHERVVLAAAGGWAFDLADQVKAWAAREPAPDGGQLIGVPRIKAALARVEARLEVLKLFNWRMVSKSDTDGGPTPGDASAVNIFVTEAAIDNCRDLLEIVGCAGYLKAGSPGAVLEARLEQAYRATIVGTFVGGNNDVQRAMIARRALNMPRSL